MDNPAQISVDKIVAAANRLRSRLETALPGAADLQGLVDAVRQSAELAGARIRGMNSSFSIPHLRLYATLLGLGVLGYWIYADYFQARTVRVAATANDTRLMRDRVMQRSSRAIDFVDCRGSADGMRLLGRGDVDATIVQGGVHVSSDADRLGVVRREHVLYFRKTAQRGERERVITFNPNQGSHVLGMQFFARWGIDVEWLFEWETVCTQESVPVPEADAVFVVVDPADPVMRVGIRRVSDAGYRLAQPNLGAFEGHLDFLQWSEIRPGFYQSRPPIPEAPHHTYTVANFLVATPSLTDRQRADVMRALGVKPPGDEFGYSVLHSSGSSVMADLASLFEGVVNLALIIAALFGLEIVLHRRYIQELDALLSEVSIMQSEHDLIGVDDAAVRRENARYLGGCADLLGLISAIAGFYSQGNAVLAFNGMANSVHARANLLKLNIQMKLMHK